MGAWEAYFRKVLIVDEHLNATAEDLEALRLAYSGGA
jgi:hypothetical protein